MWFKAGLPLSQVISFLHNRACALTGLCAGSPGALGLQNIQHGAIWCLPARALRDRLTQQAFKPSKIVNLCGNVFDVMFSDLTHLGAGRLSRPAKSKQGADLIEREPQLPPATDEVEYPRFFWPINPPIARPAP